MASPSHQSSVSVTADGMSAHPQGISATAPAAQAKIVMRMDATARFSRSRSHRG